MDIKFIRLRIEELCKERKWSYYKLAKEAGFQQSTLQAIIKEKNMPSLFTIDKICSACNITLSSFFDSSFFNSSQRLQYCEIEEVWNFLSDTEKELALTYICGLLHITPKIEKEDKTNGL